MSKLEKLLIERGISQAWLARKINKNYASLNRWTKENRTPSYGCILKMSEVLNVPVRKIVDDEVLARSIFKYLSSRNNKKIIAN